MKTILTWHKPENKLPELDSTVFVKDNITGDYTEMYYNHRGFLTQLNTVYELDEIQYWAYAEGEKVFRNNLTLKTYLLCSLAYVLFFIIMLITTTYFKLEDNINIIQQDTIYIQPTFEDSLELGKKETFIHKYLPYAIAIQEQYGVPYWLSIAVSAIETGWGTRYSNNNLHGIKYSSQPWIEKSKFKAKNKHGKVKSWIKYPSEYWSYDDFGCYTIQSVSSNALSLKPSDMDDVEAWSHWLFITVGYSGSGNYTYRDLCITISKQVKEYYENTCK